MNDDLSARTRATLSALADGQLHGDDFADALASAADAEALETWHRYHLIGDVLRSADTRADAAHDQAFLARLRTRMAAEAPLVLSTGALDSVANSSESTLTAITSDAENVRLKAVNDSLWRWRAVAGVASVAAVGALAWNLLAPGSGAAGGGAVLAQAGPEGAAPVLVASPQGAILRDARIDELLDAHRQVGSGAVLQVPAGFLRNATFEGRAR